MRLRTLGIALCLVAPSCASVAGSDRVGSDASAARAVKEELERYYADLSARDWPAFAEHFWPGATITTSWQPPGEPVVRVDVQSVEDFVAKAPEGPGSRAIFEEWMIESDVRLAGNLASAWVRYGARFGDPGELMEWSGVDAFSLLRCEGRWRIAALVFAAEE